MAAEGENIECRILNIELRSAEENPDVRRESPSRHSSFSILCPTGGPAAELGMFRNMDGREQAAGNREPGGSEGIRTTNRCMDRGL